MDIRLNLSFESYQRNPLRIELYSTKTHKTACEVGALQSLDDRGTKHTQPRNMEHSFMIKYFLKRRHIIHIWTQKSVYQIDSR